MIDAADEKKYLEKYGHIKTKRGRIEPFRFNPPQEKYYEVIRRETDAGKPVCIIVLKVRQMGFSTLTEGVIFCRSAPRPPRSATPD